MKMMLTSGITDTIARQKMNLKELYDELNDLESDREMYDDDTEESMPLEDQERLKVLRQLDQEIELTSNRHATVMTEDEFKNYCMDLALEMEWISRESPVWAHIDWEGVANDQGANHTVFEFEDETYYLL